MAALENMSLTHFLILMGTLAAAFEIILLSDPNHTWIDWKLITSTVILVGILLIGILRFIAYLNSNNSDRSA